MFIDGDLSPYASGLCSLGVDQIGDGFDADSIRPFLHIHQVSGIFHDPLGGQSGVLRYNQAAGAFQVSVDGGLTFTDLSTSSDTPEVLSIGVLGGTDLINNVDLATPSSGFMTIQQIGQTLLFSVDALGLSGLWKFPAQGFNGRVVNALTDFNGTEAQGVIQIVGASGLYADLVGNVLTITPGQTLTRAVGQNFVSVKTVTVIHNMGSQNVIVQVRDGNGAVLIPDTITTTDINTVVVTFNGNRSGRVIVIGQ